jgi:hypothetical protein
MVIGEKNLGKVKKIQAVVRGIMVRRKLKSKFNRLQ